MCVGVCLSLNSHACVTGVPRTSNSSINLFISNCTVHLESTRNKVMTSVDKSTGCGNYSCFTLVCIYGNAWVETSFC